MKYRFGSDIHTRTQLISLGPALVLTLLLCVFFAYVRLQDLREETTQTGQLITDQLAEASEYSLGSADLKALDSLLQATLSNTQVRFLEIRDQSGTILRYVERRDKPSQDSGGVEIFHANINARNSTNAAPSQLGSVAVGMSDTPFSNRQQEILIKAALLALVALALTFFLARRIALSLSQPLQAMSRALTGIQNGNYQPALDTSSDGELGELAEHINNLADNLNQSEQKHSKAIAELESAREEAEQASRAKSDFLAMMSHELRTPMNGVLGMLQLLETTAMTGEQEEYTALAGESTEHLLKVINDILDFSRIERNALELELIPFNLFELLQNSANAFHYSAQQRGLELVLDIQPGLEHLETRGDPTRFRQILVNLLGNALKFTEAGSIRLEVQWNQLDQELLWLKCVVRDSGIGVSAEQLEHMFDAFQQADNSISRRYGGTGLGLAIARTLAARMGGTLKVESQIGIGSAFTLEIPLPFHRATQRQQPEIINEEINTNGIELLLVEDNPVNQTVIEAMLRSLGYRVKLVENGAEAVQEVPRKPYAAVLMDCRMPVMDGYEATRQIRQISSCAQIPIIALTANALQGDRATCLEAGMDDYLAKPFKRADLQHILQQWLRKQGVSKP